MATVERWVQLDVRQHLGRRALLVRWLRKNRIGQRNSGDVGGDFVLHGRTRSTSVGNEGSRDVASAMGQGRASRLRR